mmetsp:Transcript_32392/g.75225  ORF Transcript_32392/g.75225 Transcript_32392/m.75225 type:complete len:219 (-) Transcript_32392:102-758(-)
MRPEAAEFVPGAFVPWVGTDGASSAATEGAEVLGDLVVAHDDAVGDHGAYFMLSGMGQQPWVEGVGVEDPSNMLAYLDEDRFFTPVPMDPSPLGSAGLRVHGRRLHWEVPGSWEELQHATRGERCESPGFTAAGASLRLELFPTGSALTPEGDCAVALVSEERTKLKFELFLNGRSSGAKVLLGGTHFLAQCSQGAFPATSGSLRPAPTAWWSVWRFT